MNWSNGYRISLVSAGVLLCSLFTLTKSLAEQIPQISNNGQEISEVVIMIAGEEHRYQPRPDLGYVIMVQDNAVAIASIQSDFNVFTQQEIKYVGGRGRKVFWMVESKPSAADNKVAIKALSVLKQVQYVAPLFSCNGEMEMIIPEIVVRVTAGTGQEELEEICRVLNLHIKRRMMFTEHEYLVDVLGEDADAVLDALIELNLIESVEWAAPNAVIQRKLQDPVVSEIKHSQGAINLFNSPPQNDNSTGFIPDDEYFPMQWHLHNTGQSGGTPGADINAPEAWEITAGDPNIIICVQDVGVELNHPDLINNLVPGYDFYQNDDSPNPILSNSFEAHGTECAGLVAAEGNNGIGVTGVAWNCKLMPTRDGTWSTIRVADVADGFRWAAANGADVLSYSAGGWQNPQPVLHSAIVDITKPGGIGRNGKGCVFCIAAGNTKGLIVGYPESYPEVITVGGTGDTDERCWYSSYGPELDITAPAGNGIIVPNLNQKQYIEEYSRLSTNLLWTTDFTGEGGDSIFNENPEILDYTEKMSGTSAACPVAAGVAALILSVEPELTNEEVRHFLERSAKDLGEPGRDDYYGWGRVDARAALDLVIAKRCDLNSDWKVDDEDLAILNVAIDANDLSADIAPSAKRDGIVDEKDLELLMQYLGIDIPEMGLIAHWKLDETEGLIVTDSAGNNGGYALGEPVWLPDGGIVNGALQLDGVDDYVVTDTAPSPEEGAYSILAWIKGGAPGQVILSQIGKTNWLRIDPSGGTLMTELTVAGRNGRSLGSETIITDGDWHRIGFVWDGSYRRLYVDGVIVAEDIQDNLDISSNGLHIGTGKNTTSGTFFSGLIDDVRIYNRIVHP